MIIILIFVSLKFAICQLSQNYKIPSYYGSRFKDFNLTGSILTCNLSSFQWHPRIDKVDDTYFFANQTFVFQIAGNVRTIIAGQETGGYQNGDLINTLFKNISAIVYFRKSSRLFKQEASKKTIILVNDSLQCLAVTKDNYTLCEASILPLSESSDLYKVYPQFPIRLIKDIYMLEETDLETFEQPLIFVSDKGNHCIRQIDLNKQLSTTFAGQCQQPGFKDGQRGVNLFNSPGEMGVDPLGNIFVYDQGNRYIRMIEPDGNVSTLLQGACREDQRKPSVFYQNVRIRNVICYKSWKKTSGEPSEHLLTAADNMQICTNHYTDCPSG